MYSALLELSAWLVVTYPTGDKQLKTVLGLCSQHMANTQEAP